MKLHLPKLLLTAVLAACVAPAAWGADVYEIDGTIDGKDLDLLDYYGDNGVFIRAASGQDVTDEVETLTVKSDLAKLVLAGHWPNQTSSASSFESLTIGTLKVGENGTGNVNLQVGTQQGSNTKSNTVTIGGVQGTITGLELANNSTLTLSGALTTTPGSSWKLNTGTNLILDNAGTIVMSNANATTFTTSGAGTLTIGSGTTVELSNTTTTQKDTCAIAGAITVKGGGTLELSGYKSLLGYKTSDSEKQAAVTLEGSSADSKAVVNITSTEAQHLSRDFILRGNAEIKGVANAYLETYNGGFIATGTNNIISTKITVNRGTTVETTNAGDTLEISGAISGSGQMTKSGAGKLILSGTNTISTFNTTGGQTDFGDATTMTKLTTTGGSSIIKGSAKVTETLAMQGGGNIDFTAGTHNIKKLDIHNSSGETTETLTIAGATVTITGGDQTEFEANQNFNTQSGAAAVVLGHWHNGTSNNGAGKIVVGGETASASVLDVSGATIRMSWDSSSNLNIKQNGTVYAKGLQFANTADDAVITLEGGRLNIGEGGLTANTNRSLNSGKKRELNLNSGTLGALADTVNITAGTTTIGGSIAIDTAIVGADGAPTGATSDINFTNDIVLAEDAALTIKGGGSVSFGSLAVNKTLAVTATNNTTLDITTLTVDPINHGLTEVSRIGDSYYTNDGTAHTTSGFKVENVTYRLFDGYVWSGDVAGFTVGEQDGDTVLSQSGAGTIYFVNEGTHTVSTAGDYINGRATGYFVDEGATLKIDGNQSDGMTAADILTTSTGAGNIELTTDVTLAAGSSTSVGGKLSVSNATIKVDTTGDHNAIKLLTTSLASFNKVSLDGATIEYLGATSELQNVTVGTAGANLKFKDMAETSSEFKLTGTTLLNGNLTIGQTTGDAWKYTVHISKLTGSGDISLSSTAKSGQTGQIGKLIIDSLQGYTGAISVTKNVGPALLTATTGGAVSLKGITLASGAEGTVITTGNAGLGNVSLSGGASLDMWKKSASLTTTISSLSVTDSATVGTERHSSCHNGTFNISSLSNTGDSATLTLKNGSQTDSATVFNLSGSSALKGTINIQSDSYRGDNNDDDNVLEMKRKLQVNLNSVEVASKAVINFQDASDTTGKNGEGSANNVRANYNILGVGVDGAKVAGLSGTTTNAATVKSSTEDATRTLEITGSGNNTTNATVENSVKLLMSGSGQQTFTGTVNASAISVTAGELVFNNAVSVAEVSVTGGTLTVGTYDGTGSLTTEQSLTATSRATFGAGAVVNANLVLSSGATVTMAEALTMGSTLTLSKGMTLDGTMLASVNGLREGKTVDLFKSVDSLILGNATYDADNALAEGTVSLKQYFTNVTNEDIYLAFNKGNVFAGIMSIPEPTTATLSLLALAGLAARRRRK